MQSEFGPHAEFSETPAVAARQNVQDRDTHEPTIPVAPVSAAIATAMKPFMDRLEGAEQTATSALGTSTLHSSSVSCAVLHDEGPVKIERTPERDRQNHNAPFC